MIHTIGLFCLFFDTFTTTYHWNINDCKNEVHSRSVIDCLQYHCALLIMTALASVCQWVFWLVLWISHHKGNPVAKFLTCTEIYCTGICLPTLSTCMYVIHCPIHCLHKPKAPKLESLTILTCKELAYHLVCHLRCEIYLPMPRENFPHYNG